MKTVIDLDHLKARSFFLEGNNYCNFDIPKYFKFDDLLNKLSLKLGDAELSNFYFKDHSGRVIFPNDIVNANYRILGNKDGQFAWRPFELIHPALYVYLVHLITKEKNWKFVQNRFKSYKNSAVICKSIPVVSTTKKSHRAEQVLQWWEGMEQESVSFGLEYNYVLDADVTDCYGSIYTHSISWALHGKLAARQDRRSHKLLGSKIDSCMQAMHYRQTNGIPQGNTVSDFIAEMVLGYADELLTEKIKACKKKDYKILRYRDDYRIFTNKPDIGRFILKSLSETLSELGMRLNTAKTKEATDPILASIKEDKIDELFIPAKKNNFSKWLVQIYATVYKHPNSGKAARQLNVYHDELLNKQQEGKKLKTYEKPDVMISMIINMAIKNPRYYNWTMAIASILLEYCPKRKKVQLTNKIMEKFKLIPNTGLLDLWLQRITFPNMPDKQFAEPICKLVTLGVYPGNNKVWPSSWLTSDMEKIVIKTRIVDRSELRKLKPVITRDETDMFHPIVIS